jgi:signal transduction histidine kinase
VSDEHGMSFEDEEYRRLARRCRAAAGLLAALGAFLILASDIPNRLQLKPGWLALHVVVHVFLVVSGIAVSVFAPAEGALSAARRTLLVVWSFGVLAAFDLAHFVLLPARGSMAVYSAATLGVAVLRLPGRAAGMAHATQLVVLAASLALFGDRAATADVVAAVLATAAAILVQRFQLNAVRVDFEQRQVIAQQSAALAAANAQLGEQNARLVRLDQEKNEFLGIAAHDLKNPLSAIRGYTQMLIEEDVDPEERREVHDKVLRASERMFQLVCNLLDVNAIERGEVKVTLADVAFDQLVERALDPHRAAAAAKGQEMVVDVAAPARVRADASLAHQVVDNLVSNAVKYSPPGKRITVRLRCGPSVVRLEVQDEGPGLTAEDQAKLFGKFARLSAKPTGGEHSTGLGLSIVKRLVESMNGRVWCESAPGRGATFLLELPAVPPSGGSS